MSTTLVTGLWDIKREDLNSHWKRDFKDHYIAKFIELLKVSENLIIFGKKELEEVIFQHRSKDNTQFIEREESWFENEFYDNIQLIRKDPNWINQAGWLKESTQAKLEMYNPLVMSKMFLLNDARILDKFNSEQLFWIDAGIANTVHTGYFTHDKVLSKLKTKLDKFHFVCFPYKADKEIHGFSYPEINEFANDDVKIVARGGFFGGPKHTIEKVSSLYYNLLSSTLSQKFMGTEESVFSIMCYLYPEYISYSLIKENGLLSKFFEDIKNEKLKVFANYKTESKLDLSRIGLYVLTFNSPEQFKVLCESMVKYDSNFLNIPEKILVNNSTQKKYNSEYKLLCKQYGFKEIKKDNIGICGGRQFIAEHFEESNLDYYFFFEDDMAFYTGNDNYCKNGFGRSVEDLFKKSLGIIHKEELDFLKLNFTEFFGDNTKQWAWHNVPQEVRLELFTNHPPNTKVKRGLEPFTKFTNIKSFQEVPYALGEIYYCNWPQIVSRKGNRKMFLETKWKHPYEQTWMSYIYQHTVKGNIIPGILLLTPTEHYRFDHYSGQERREN